MKNLLFVIPARAGSKGVPDKNLQEVGGVPLVGRACSNAAAAAARIEGGTHRVICSTDSEEIASVARGHGAIVPFMRPGHLASDSAATIDVVLHCMDRDGGDYEGVITIQPTTPFTEPDDIVGAVALFRKTGDPVVSVCLNEHPAEWMMRLSEGEKLDWIIPWGGVHQRQKARLSYRLNGAVYVASQAMLREGEGYLNGKTRAYQMPTERSLDVDTPEDLAMARAMSAFWSGQEARGE